MGITSNGGSTTLPEESLAFAAEAKRSYELGALGTSPEVAILDPALGHGHRVMKKTSSTSGLYPRPDGPSKGSPEVFASHSETSGTTSLPELEALP